ncbi:S-adenosyl-L-methionine-dependent methyltransferase [Mycena latifolia]|nr:S-adenosyl-L-methionine-dependent methyltransferase [Mycena latifolia]
MPDTPGKTLDTKGTTYILPAVHGEKDELQRLDEMHAGISQYFGGQLAPAPIADVLPRKIVDLGCGSGAWAIQAAKQFPDAEVLAVDISPLPESLILPMNMRFERADLAHELNFEPETFDIVHSRFVMCHVSNGKDATERAASLVRPGGLLLLEDTDLTRIIETGGPVVRAVSSHFKDLLTARGADGEIGRKFEGIIAALGSFEDIHADQIIVPLCGTTPDAAMNELAVAMRKSAAQALAAAKGVAKEMAQQYKEEMGQKGCEGSMYFVWARRSSN